ncbi:flagellar hook-length control protein FliK [Geopseudomonas guangdongensis]|uniref:Flagellar hook-length control protein FliK n=1 Tax=Geopseudomonas guangdongensis TaxID=1245526 RepID=A0A1H2EPJ7_9GAMM|nr:flagellar hook-length control protein FliK [Pseudomonas guangdongensis]SDT97060.1 flagellar hook-length control protein FliK [Pseudomonas guangdongensis]
MDIIALPATPAATTPPSTAPRQDEGFARSLEQASARQPAGGDKSGGRTATDTRTARSTPPSAQSSDHEAQDAGYDSAVPTELAALLSLQTLPVAMPDNEGAATPSNPLPGEAPLPAILPGSAELVAADAVLLATSQDAAPVAPGAPLLPSDSAADSLAQISARLALIEQAGNPLPANEMAAAQNGAAPLAATPLAGLNPLPRSDSQSAASATLDNLTGTRTQSVPQPTLVPSTSAAAMPAADAASAPAAPLPSSAAGFDIPEGLQTVRSEPFAPSLAAATTSSPAASLPAATLSAPLGSSDWQQGLGQQLIGLHQRGGQQIELHLHPAELGPLSISLKLGDNAAHAHFLAAHPQVRAAIEQALPQLREALAEQGITLGETSVGEQRQQQAQGEPGSRSEARGEQLAGNGEADEIATGLPQAGARTTTGLLAGGIDLYA